MTVNMRPPGVPTNPQRVELSAHLLSRALRGLEGVNRAGVAAVRAGAKVCLLQHLGRGISVLFSHAWREGEEGERVSV